MSQKQTASTAGYAFCPRNGVWLEHEVFIFTISKRRALIRAVDGLCSLPAIGPMIGLALLGEPDNILIRLSNDVLPDPDAIMVTGITPQSTLMDGITEAEFL